MIEVTIGTNTNRKKVQADPNQTLRSVLEENDVDYGRAQVHIDGAPTQPGDLSKTFNDLGITDKCYIVAVVKADNAA